MRLDDFIEMFKNHEAVKAPYITPQRIKIIEYVQSQIGEEQGEKNG